MVDPAKASRSSWQAQQSAASFPNRHDHIFSHLAKLLRDCDSRQPRILSFGCSSGYECLDLKRLIPSASIFGCDICAKSVADATERCTKHGITIFESSPQAIAQHAPFHAITAMSVLTRYPAIRDLDNINNIYPFTCFEQAIEVLSKGLAVNGYLVLYNSPYLLERTQVAQFFRPIHATLGPGNGWIDKYDESGRRLTRVEATINGRIFRSAREWRETIQKQWIRFIASDLANERLGCDSKQDLTVCGAELSPYRHIVVAEVSKEPDCKTVIWQKMEAIRAQES